MCKGYVSFSETPCVYLPVLFLEQSNQINIKSYERKTVLVLRVRDLARRHCGVVNSTLSSPNL